MGKGLSGDSKMKKFFMKQKWRFQQAYWIWSAFQGVLNTAGIWLNHIQKVIPISSWILVPLIIVLNFGGFLFFGWWLDKKAQIWVEEQDVSAERNQYTTEKPYFKSVKYDFPLQREGYKNSLKLWKQFNISITPYLKALSPIIIWQDYWTEYYQLPALSKMEEINDT